MDPIKPKDSGVAGTQFYEKVKTDTILFRTIHTGNIYIYILNGIDVKVFIH